MPRIPEDPPDLQTLIRDDMEFTIGNRDHGADLSWGDIQTLKARISAHNAHHPDEPVEKLTLKHLKALISVMRAFPGSYVLLGIEGLD